MRLVRMAEKGSKTKLHRGFTETIKTHTEDNKAPENTQAFRRQWLYIEERQVTGRNTG